MARGAQAPLDEPSVPDGAELRAWPRVEPLALDAVEQPDVPPDVLLDGVPVPAGLQALDAAVQPDVPPDVLLAPAWQQEPVLLRDEPARPAELLV